MAPVVVAVAAKFIPDLLMWVIGRKRRRKEVDKIMSIFGGSRTVATAVAGILMKFWNKFAPGHDLPAMGADMEQFVVGILMFVIAIFIRKGIDKATT